MLLRTFSLFIVVVFGLSGAVTAQTTSATSGSTPTGLSPGAPAGSYSLSGFENVNLFNGNVNFNLDLLKIGGRGGAGMQVSVSFDSVKWSVEKESIAGTENATNCGAGDPEHEGCPHGVPYNVPPGGG